ncbi:MAG: ATP-binding protein [Verrucomicrobiota bacterium]
MTPPDYFNRVAASAGELWVKLKDPVLAGPWKQLFAQVQSPRHVLSELLQNADDAGAKSASVRVVNNEFVFEHDGEDFTEAQFQSLSRFGFSNKRNLHTIGFRGVGFKSTFSLGNSVRIQTPTLDVVFERERFPGTQRQNSKSECHPTF